MDRMTRRRFLGATGTAGVAGLAGCGNTSSDKAKLIDAGMRVGLDVWLDSDEVGGKASNYDGKILDARNNKSFTVKVGAEGNGGNLAFDPVALLVSRGTTVKWEWTGKGGAHNVVAEPVPYVDSVDTITFNSGNPQETREDPFTVTRAGAATAMYRCENHLDAGMKGSVLWR
ncbi:MAG: halocyanin domain-containing protein [Halobacteriaceae archaeon]